MGQDRIFVVNVKVLDTRIGFPASRVFGSTHVCFTDVNGYRANESSSQQGSEPGAGVYGRAPIEYAHGIEFPVQAIKLVRFQEQC